MIILDTNVVSELMRGIASPVVAWLATTSDEDLYTTAITEAEIWRGLALLPGGKRRIALEGAARRAFEGFEGRIVAFDSDAALAYAALHAERRRRGRPIAYADAQIAAITHSRVATLATRNTRDFEHCGIAVVDPWRG